ncbi:unnamed protein product [Orchesella dallaii]|uniref:Phospholipid scramblase n=1 Tax=Orchesella dallaii TaxID=48710 RepID=A0ABP1QI24_9HEXA
MSSKSKDIQEVYKSVITRNKVADTPIIITTEKASFPVFPKKNENPIESPLSNFIASSTTIKPKTQESVSNIKVSKQTLGRDLQPLKEEESIFIYQVPQAAEEFQNVPNKYEIMDSNGYKIYSVVETTDGLTRRLFRNDQPFKLKLLNLEGESILDLVGDTGISGLGAYVKLQRHSAVIGKVVQVSPLFACCNFSPSYNVTITAKGEPVYRIVRPRGRLTSCVFTNEFQIYSVKNKSVPVGKVSRENDSESSFFKQKYTADADKYALILHDNELGCTVKVLLVAAVIMLDFQFFEGKEGSHTRKCCIAVAVLILLLILIAVLLAVFLVF